MSGPYREGGQNHRRLKPARSISFVEGRRYNHHMLDQLFSRTRAKVVAVVFAVLTVWRIVRWLLDLYGYIQSVNDALGSWKFITQPFFAPIVYAVGIILLASAYIAGGKKEKEVGFAPGKRRKVNWWEIAVVISFFIAVLFGIGELNNYFRKPVTQLPAAPVPVFQPPLPQNQKQKLPLA